MEYKICENCGAKLHVRTAKCPICNILLTDASKIVNDDIVSSEPQEAIGENIDIKISDNEIMTDNGANNKQINNIESNNIETTVPLVNNNQTEEVKDYVYKAEVRHSLEYTRPMSNGLKVIITALSMMPIIGQFIGTFLGIFFSTYEDNDRNSFGKALIILSIIMFMLYGYSLMISSELLSSAEFSNIINNF